MRGDKRRILGERSEEVVAELLIRGGFKILGRNFRTRFGEVDVIAERGGVVYIVVVRSTQKIKGFSPMITRKKLHRVYQVGSSFMRLRNMDLDRIVILLASVVWNNSHSPEIEFVQVT